MAGYYIRNDAVDAYVLIEAPSEAAASSKLCEITTEYSEYCDCCGERWSPSYPDGPYDRPQIYENSVYNHYKEGRWFREGHAIVYHYNGKIEKVDLKHSTETETATL